MDLDIRIYNKPMNRIIISDSSVFGAPELLWRVLFLFFLRCLFY